MNNKIPSMKTFLRTESIKLRKIHGRSFKEFRDHADTLLKHADFLDKKLLLGDFVPTFEHNDETFSEFQMDCLNHEKNPPEMLAKAYEAAKKNIIFKDWELKKETDNHIEIGMVNAYFKLTWDKRTKEFCECRTIEDMIIFDLSTNLKFE